MLKKKIIQTVKISVGIMCAFVCSGLHAAEQSSQALEQLQLLQKNVDKASPKKEVKNKAEPGKNTSQKKAMPKSAQERSVDKPTVKKQDGGSSEGGPIASDEDSINAIAFNQVKRRMYPLKPEQVVDLHRKLNESEFVLAKTPGTPPRPTASSQLVNLSPGSTPPVIRLAQGFVSSVVFLDSTGAPWPIVSYDLGDPNAFNIQWDKSGNTLMIQSKKLYTYGNLAVRLDKLNTPVMLTLIPGQKAVDYRIDMRVQGYGPNAKNLNIGSGLPVPASNLLLKVLEGVPPSGSNRLIVKGGPAGAWVLGDRMFVRTRLTILSPGWISTMTSADGTHAYEMSKAPVLLVSWHGKVMQLKLEGL